MKANARVNTPYSDQTRSNRLRFLRRLSDAQHLLRATLIRPQFYRMGKLCNRTLMGRGKSFWGVP